jgi:HKD family nuclease
MGMNIHVREKAGSQVNARSKGCPRFDAFAGGGTVMNTIFSNTNQRSDFFGWELEKAGETTTDVDIAVAFFTEHGFIRKLVDNGCTVRLIVRLRFPTSPRSLSRILHLRNVYVRFFNAGSFHPKLYIFGNRVAYVGSSNLTDRGLISNQELNVAIDSEKPAFEVLKETFSQYWEQAAILTDDMLEEHLSASSTLSEIDKLRRNAEKEVEAKIGRVEFSNIKCGSKKKPQSRIGETFLKRYERFLGEFKNLRGIYESVRRRKLPQETLPLRIEIDQFLNWI